MAEIEEMKKSLRCWWSRTIFCPCEYYKTCIEGEKRFKAKGHIVKHSIGKHTGIDVEELCIEL